MGWWLVVTNTSGTLLRASASITINCDSTYASRSSQYQELVSALCMHRNQLPMLLAMELLVLLRCRASRKSGCSKMNMTLGSSYTVIYGPPPLRLGYTYHQHRSPFVHQFVAVWSCGLQLHIFYNSKSSLAQRRLGPNHLSFLRKMEPTELLFMMLRNI